MSLRDLSALPDFQRWFAGSKVTTPDGKPLVAYHGTDAKEPFTEFTSPSWFTENSIEADAYSFADRIARREQLANKFVESSAAGSFDGLRVGYVGAHTDVPEDGQVWATDNGVVRRLPNHRFEFFTDVEPDIDSYRTSKAAWSTTVALKTADTSDHLRGLRAEHEDYAKRNLAGGEHGRVYPVYLSIRSPLKLSSLDANKWSSRLQRDNPHWLSQWNDQVAKWTSMGHDGLETTSDEASFHPEIADKLGRQVRQWIPFRAHQIKSIYGQGFSCDRHH